MRFIFFSLNIIFIFLLLLSYAAGFISPDSNLWWIQLIGMAYGALLLINIGFVILWSILRSRRLLFSLAAILLGYSRIFSLYEPRFYHKALEKENEFTVMSYNVRLFDLYNWFHNTDTRRKMFQFLKEKSPDIVCFQEYYHSDGPDVNTSNNRALLSVLSAPYSHIEYSKTLHEHDHWGIATFSKYPIIGKQRINFKNSNKDIFI